MRCVGFSAPVLGDVYFVFPPVGQSQVFPCGILRSVGEKNRISFFIRSVKGRIGRYKGAIPDRRERTDAVFVDGDLKPGHRGVSVYLPCNTHRVSDCDRGIPFSGKGGRRNIGRL